MVLQPDLFFADIDLLDGVDQFLFEAVGVIIIFSDLIVQQFLQAFADRLAVLGYERDAEGNGQFLLGQWDEPWSYASQPS